MRPALQGDCCFFCRIGNNAAAIYAFIVQEQQRDRRKNEQGYAQCQHRHHQLISKGQAERFIGKKQFPKEIGLIKRVRIKRGLGHSAAHDGEQGI